MGVTLNFTTAWGTNSMRKIRVAIGTTRGPLRGANVAAPPQRTEDRMTKLSWFGVLLSLFLFIVPAQAQVDPLAAESGRR